MKRVICLLLVACFMVVALVSCGGKGDETGGSDSNGENNTPATKPVETDEYGQESFTSVVPVEELDFEGETIKIIVRDSMNVQREWYKDVTEDDLDEVIAMRNEAVAETLNLTVQYEALASSDYDDCLNTFIRVSEVLSQKDEEKIVAFAKATDTVVSVVEPFYDPKIIDKKRESLKERIVAGDPSKLYVTSGGIRIECMPSSFVQVNRFLNTKMLDRVCSYVEDGKDSVLDLFCGLGNFTFPLTKKAKNVVGVDIVARMVLDARENAKEQGIDNISFEIADLEEQFENQKWAKEDYDVVVMDPGRAGAKRATLFLAKKKPKRIIYISCNPLAASRDSQELVMKNYKLSSWGVIDMFPRTAHIEMILVFDLENKKK